MKRVKTAKKVKKVKKMNNQTVMLKWTKELWISSIRSKNSLRKRLQLLCQKQRASKRAQSRIEETLKTRKKPTKMRNRKNQTLLMRMSLQFNKIPTVLLHPTRSHTTKCQKDS
jgi:hypothetical protein